MEGRSGGASTRVWWRGSGAGQGGTRQPHMPACPLACIRLAGSSRQTARGRSCSPRHSKTFVVGVGPNPSPAGRRAGGQAIMPGR